MKKRVIADATTYFFSSIDVKLPKCKKKKKKKKKNKKKEKKNLLPTTNIT